MKNLKNKIVNLFPNVSILAIALMISGVSIAVAGFTVDNSGNVGIGTSTPSTNLEVNGGIKISSGSGGGITFADGSTQISAGSGAPIGSVISYAGTTTPNGWLLADGSAISRNTYNSLFSIIGTIYGVGDGSTTFNLPTLSVNSSNLQDYWKLDNNNSDSSGNGNTLSDIGSPAFISGKIGQASDSGSTWGAAIGRVASAPAFGGTGNVSMSFWGRINNNQMAANTTAIFASISPSDDLYVGYDIRYYTDTNGVKHVAFCRNRYGTADDCVVLIRGLDVGDWHNFSITYDGTVIKGYLDGSYVGSVNSSGNGANAYGQGIGIHGAWRNGSQLQNPIPSAVDEVKIYTRVLSDDEIKALSNPTRLFSIMKY